MKKIIMLLAVLACADQGISMQKNPTSSGSSGGGSPMELGSSQATPKTWDDVVDAIKPKQEGFEDAMMLGKIKLILNKYRTDGSQVTDDEIKSCILDTPYAESLLGILKQEGKLTPEIAKQVYTVLFTKSKKYTEGPKYKNNPLNDEKQQIEKALKAINWLQK